MIFSTRLIKYLNKTVKRPKIYILFLYLYENVIRWLSTWIQYMDIWFEIMFGTNPEWNFWIVNQTNSNKTRCIDRYIIAILHWEPVQIFILCSVKL